MDSISSDSSLLDNGSAIDSSCSQKRKASTTTLSLYDSDEELKAPPKKAFSQKIEENSGIFIPATSNDAKKEGASPNQSSILHSVCIERKGEREEMQDRHLIIDNFGDSFGNLLPSVDLQGVSERRCAFYALFDGHAGKRAADYCAEHFAHHFISVCKKYVPSNNGDIAIFEKSLKKIFIETYKNIDEEFLIEARKQKPTMKDGTTATTIFLLHNLLYCANIGDSKAVVCRHKADKKENIALQLSVDHSPILFEERMRIQKSGGTVKDGRVMGILEVSRSIGDGQMKAHGVICTPDIKKLTITADDLFLLLACDGLWKIFTPQTVLEFVATHYKQFYRETAEYHKTKENSIELWTKIADEMNAEAVRKGCGDNVTILMVILADASKLNAAFLV